MPKMNKIYQTELEKSSANGFNYNDLHFPCLNLSYNVCFFENKQLKNYLANKFHLNALFFEFKIWIHNATFIPTTKVFK